MAQSRGKSAGQVSASSAFPQSTAGSLKRTRTICGGCNIAAAIASIKALNIIKRTFSIEQAA